MKIEKAFRIRAFKKFIAVKCTYINIWYIVAEAGSTGIVCMHVPPYHTSTVQSTSIVIHMYVYTP